MVRVVPRVLVLLLWLGACGSSPDPPQLQGPETVAWAQSVMARGHNKAAAAELEKLVLNYPDREFSDEAQYLLGQAHMEMREYILAENAFRLLLSSYPGSSFREQAELGIALCYAKQAPQYQLDQSATHSAVRAFERFIEDHPGSPYLSVALEELRRCRERQAEKLLKAGIFYLRRGRVESAKIYLDQVRDEYPDTRMAVESRYYVAKCIEKEGDNHRAALGYSTLLSELDDDDPLRGELAESLSKVRKKLSSD
jgi:outer membrane assembly lipoprotein YfiO